MGGTPTIDWGSVKSTAEESPQIDWDKVPNTGVETAPTGTIGPQTGPESHPVEHWLTQLEGDIRNGTTDTLPGRVLHRMGAEGIDSGAGGGEIPGVGGGGPEVGEIMGGGVIGPVEAAHGITTIASPSATGAQRLHGAVEALRGIGKTALPVQAAVAPETLPLTIPSVASYGPIGHGVGKVASELGANPDESELASDAAMIAIPGVKAGMEPAGRFLENNAGTVGKVAGYGAGIAEALKTKNPLWLIGSPAAERVATTAADSAGRGMQSVGNTPLFPHESVGDLRESAEPRPLVEEPKQLTSGSIVTPPPEPEPTPRSQPASVIVRGPGGRITKQYLTGTVEPGTPPRYGQQEPVMPQVGGPKTPPRIVNGNLIDTSSLPPQSKVAGPMSPEAEAINVTDAENVPSGPKAFLAHANKLVDDAIAERGGDPLSGRQQTPIATGVGRTTPLVDTRTPTNREDLMDDKGIQQEMRQRVNNDEQTADTLGKRVFYKNNKPVPTSRKTGQPLIQVVPGEGNEETLPQLESPYHKPLVDIKPNASTKLLSSSSKNKKEGELPPQLQRIAESIQPKYRTAAEFTADNGHEAIASVQPHEADTIDINDPNRFKQGELQTKGHELFHLWRNNLPGPIQQRALPDNMKDPYNISDINELRKKGYDMSNIPNEQGAYIVQRYIEYPEERKRLQPWIDDMGKIQMSVMRGTDPEQNGINTEARAPLPPVNSY